VIPTPSIAGWLRVLATIFLLAACSARPAPAGDPAPAAAPATTVPAAAPASLPTSNAPTAPVTAPESNAQTAPVTTPTVAPAPPAASTPSAAPRDAAPSLLCERDSDCAIKDIGSCCGYRPACVNADAQTFPEEVQARCAREGRVGICGFQAIDGCRCEAGRCEGTLLMEHGKTKLLEPTQ